MELHRARVVDAGRVITGGGISSGMGLGFYRLERHGYDATFVGHAARIMECQPQWELMRGDRFVVT